MAEVHTWEAMRLQIAESLRKRTGEDVEAWKAKIAEAKPANEAALRGWLGEQGVAGYPQNLLVWETFGYPDYLVAGAGELIEGQYADQPQLRPILDAILAIAPSLGRVDVQARKGYVTLVGPRRTFASVEPTTKNRVDLALRLPDPQPEGRLSPARNLAQSGMNARIPLASPEEVDDEVRQWLARAYDANL